MEKSTLLKFAIPALKSDRVDALRTALGALEGVVQIDLNVSRRLARVVATREMGLGDVARALRPLGLEPRRLDEPSRETCEVRPSGRPSWSQLLMLFALVLILGQVVSRMGWLRPQVALGASTSFVAVMLLGLVAGTSSCIAVSGGLMLGVIAKARARMRTTVMFVAGRIISYAVLGGAIGAVGKALTPSPYVVGALTVLAALAMLIMGLQMLHLAPAWLMGLMPRMPKSWGHKILDREGSTHPTAPFLLGAATFFLPCGFTQALQLYALTTGSAATSAGILLAFALGTAPALLALGWASNSLKGKAGTLFYRFAGALLIVLGFWNMQNGLSITGIPIAFPRLNLGAEGVAASESAVLYNGKEQVVDLTVDYGGYSPREFTLQRDVPARIRASGPGIGGCLSILQIPKLGIRKRLDPNGVTEIAFTPKDPGRYPFSCAMGMFRGTFEVL